MINRNLLKIEKENTFSKISKIVNTYKKKKKDFDIINLGIGDVSKPIDSTIIKAMHKAVDDLKDMKTFKGYGLYYGLDTLKKTILDNEYGKFKFSLDEIYISNGTKCDSTNILELFDEKCKILLSNPMYPIYKNGALALSRKFDEVKLDSNFKMQVPKKHYDIIYICSPNNPIGNAYTKKELEAFINYANKNKSVIIYDNVYNSFIESKDVPKSIYEIKGSKTCAIELRSFSKSASFTSLRCSYFIIPNAIEKDINYYYKERTLNRFNGADYISQIGALAFYNPKVLQNIESNIKEYKLNTQYLRKSFIDMGFETVGGIDSPYLWIKIKEKKFTSWDLFNFFLNKFEIIVIPGIIFGDQGDKYFRVSGLGYLKNSKKAISRLRKYYEK